MRGFIISTEIHIYNNSIQIKQFTHLPTHSYHTHTNYKFISHRFINLEQSRTSFQRRFSSQKNCPTFQRWLASILKYLRNSMICPGDKIVTQGPDELHL